MLVGQSKQGCSLARPRLVGQPVSAAIVPATVLVAGASPAGRVPAAGLRVEARKLYKYARISMMRNHFEKSFAPGRSPDTRIACQ